MTNGWTTVMPSLSPDQRARLVDEVAGQLSGLSLSELRGDRDKLIGRAAPLMQAAVSRSGLTVPVSDVTEMIREVVARLGGLGYLEPMLRLDSGLSEITMTPAGDVWVLRKGELAFERVTARPSPTEAWRAVETLLAPLGRACTEATPSVDAKLPRSESLPGGARIKIIHPVVAPGNGYPSINIRLFEPRPVPPEQLIKWNVAPEPVIRGLVEMASQTYRILVIGGTASGKTTLLSALAHGIPKWARVVKIEDPEEIWLDHPHVVTLEARPSQPGSSVPSYTLANAVDDAMRMSPKWLILGEIRRGDAAAALFRAQMSDHPGLSTFHAESPQAAVKRLALLLAIDEKFPSSGAKELFAEAVDVVVQVGSLDGKRALLGVHEVRKELRAGDVAFQSLYAPGDEKLKPLEAKRIG